MVRKCAEVDRVVFDRALGGDQHHIRTVVYNRPHAFVVIAVQFILASYVTAVVPTCPGIRRP